MSEEPKPEDYRKIKKEMTLLEPVFVFHGMAEQDRREPEGRQVGGRKLQLWGSPRRCCVEDKAQGHVPRRIEHACYGRPGERWGKGYRQMERGTQVSKGHMI